MQNEVYHKSIHKINFLRKRECVMGQIVLMMCSIICVSGLSGCDNNKDSNNNDIAVGVQDETSIYLVAMDGTKFNDSLNTSNIGCDDKLVEVKIDKKLSPQEALEELFAYEEYNEEEGLYNVFGLSDNLKVEKMVVANDFAIVTLSEDLFVGGMCDDPRVYAQITETLIQFDEIDGVDIFIGDEELSSYLLDVSEEELGGPIN